MLFLTIVAACAILLLVGPFIRPLLAIFFTMIVPVGLTLTAMVVFYYAVQQAAH